MRVSVGIETTPEEVQALEEVFRLAEIPVLVDDEIARFSVDSPWIMYVCAPLDWISSRFARISEDAPPKSARTRSRGLHRAVLGRLPR